MIETGSNTGIFRQTLKFTTGPSNPSSSTLHVSPGDVFTLYSKNETKNRVNGLIQSSQGDVNAISVNGLGTVTATYKGVSESSRLLDFEKPPVGGGGGGATRPSLVIDVGPKTDPDPNDDRNGSTCSGDCIPPTLGLDKKHKRLVTHGFSYNDNPVDSELYYTPYPLITVEVGEKNKAVLKIYDDGGPQNIKHVGFGFGMGKGESFADSRAKINLDIDHDGTENVSLDDPENVLDDVRVVTKKVPCTDDIVSPTCLQVIFFHTFREELEFNMVGTYVWDFKQNAWQNYYNHGIHIEGESLNPPKTDLVAFGTKDMRGLYELTRIDKIKDLWRDEFGNVYQHKGNDRYDVVYSEPKSFVRDNLTSHGCDRNCNWFNEYKIEQESLAKIKLSEILNGKVIEGEPLEEPFTIYYHFIDRKDDPILQENMKKEADRVLETFAESYPKKPVHNFSK